MCGECQCAVTDMTVYLHPAVWKPLLMPCVRVRENDYGKMMPDVCFKENIGNVLPSTSRTPPSDLFSSLAHT